MQVVYLLCNLRKSWEEVGKEPGVCQQQHDCPQLWQENSEKSRAYGVDIANLLCGPNKVAIKSCKART